MPAAVETRINIHSFDLGQLEPSQKIDTAPFRVIARPPEGLPPVKFEEEEMDNHWPSFMQRFVFQPIINENEQLVEVRVFTGTWNLPVGSKFLLPDILTESQIGETRRIDLQGKEEARDNLTYLASYNDEDTLLHSRQTTKKLVADEDVIGAFEAYIDAAEKVVRARHPYQDHSSVQAFYEDNQTRREKGTYKKLCEIGLDTLLNPESEIFNAMNQVHDIDGIHIMGWRFFPLGSSAAVDPDGNVRTIDETIARPGYGHDKWMGHFAKLTKEWVSKIQSVLSERRLARMHHLSHLPEIGDLLNVVTGCHGDGTLDVLDCFEEAFGSSSSCSESFEDNIIGMLKEQVTAVNHILKILPKKVLDGESESIQNICEKCNKSKDSLNESEKCNC